MPRTACPSYTRLPLLVLASGACLLTLAVPAAAAPAKKPPAGPILPSKAPQTAPLAIVNGERIPLSLYLDRLSLKYGPEFREALIEETLIRQEAKRRKLTATRAEIEALVKRTVKDSATSLGGEDRLAAELERTRGWTLDDYRSVVREQASAQIHKEKIAAQLVAPAKVTAKEIEQAYNEQRQSFAEPDTAQISHILVKRPLANDSAADRAARERANGLLDKIKLDGAEAFSAAAKADSDDKITGPMGGKIPTPITRGQHPFGAAFEAAVFGGEPGLVQEVVATPTGYHVIRIDSKKPGRQLPLAEVKDRIRAALLAQRRAQALDELYVRLRSSAKVQVGRF